MGRSGCATTNGRTGGESKYPAENATKNLYGTIPRCPHRLADPTFRNLRQNESDDLPASIQTTVKIGNLCSAKKSLNHLMYIHRCGFGDCPPKICCSVHVSKVEAIGGWIMV
jgi:hypothetical protein